MAGPLSLDNVSWDDVPTCRICHCTESPSSGLIKLISPCQCSGSLKYVHHSCLQQWLDATNNQRCELCKHPFSMTVKYKPIYKWGSLNASPNERRRLICNSVFNLVSMVCIFWSIYVLIERASIDAKGGQIDWSFYVKISVVTIGLIIGVIFLFVQLKLYFSIFMKWRQSNRIVVIRNANLTSNPQSTTVAAATTSANMPDVVVITTTSSSILPTNPTTNIHGNTRETGNYTDSAFTALDIDCSDLKGNIVNSDVTFIKQGESKTENENKTESNTNNENSEGGNPNTAIKLTVY